jgi:AI-2E family transporter
MEQTLALLTYPLDHSAAHRHPVLAAQLCDQPHSDLDRGCLAGLCHAVVIALTQSWQLALITLAYTILIDMLEGYVLSPRILAKAVEIRPVVTLLAMIAGSQVFGIWGAVFAAPTAGLIQALVGAFWQYYEKTHVQEFPLQQVEQAANPQEESALLIAAEPAIKEPLA